MILVEDGGGQEGDRRRLVEPLRAPQPAQGLQTVQQGHVGVQKNEIKRPGQGEVDRRLPVRRTRRGLSIGV